MSLGSDPEQRPDGATDIRAVLALLRERDLALAEIGDLQAQISAYDAILGGAFPRIHRTPNLDE